MLERCPEAATLSHYDDIRMIPAGPSASENLHPSAEGAIRVSIRGINSDVDDQAIVLRPWPDLGRAGPIIGGGAVKVWDCGPSPTNTKDISSKLPSSCRAGASQIGTVTAFEASAS